MRDCPRCPDVELEDVGDGYQCPNCARRFALPGRPWSAVEIAEAVDRVRRERRALAPSCLGRLHRQCNATICGCWCHEEAANVA
jgi:hypothetical protein